MGPSVTTKGIQRKLSIVAELFNIAVSFNAKIPVRCKRVLITVTSESQYVKEILWTAVKDDFITEKTNFKNWKLYVSYIFYFAIVKRNST